MTRRFSIIIVAIMFGLWSVFAPLAKWVTTARYGTYTATFSEVTYHWNNDAWCPRAGPQTIWVNSPNDWGVSSRQAFSTVCWVMTYPHIGWWGGKKLSAYSAIVGQATETGPGYGSPLLWEAAYDIWLNSMPGVDSGYEIMIWTDVSGGVSPGGSFTTVTIAGVRYRYYHKSQGSWFVRTSNAQTTTTDVRAVIAYAAQYADLGDPEVGTIEFGWEVWGTGNKTVPFHVSRFGIQASIGG